MDIKDKITQTLIGITAQLQEINSEFYIIGASAMILSNIEIGETSDIDILTIIFPTETSLYSCTQTGCQILFFLTWRFPMTSISIRGRLNLAKLE